MRVDNFKINKNVNSTKIIIIRLRFQSCTSKFYATVLFYTGWLLNYFIYFFGENGRHWGKKNIQKWRQKKTNFSQNTKLRDFWIK